jgi:hypothetical protein
LLNNDYSAKPSLSVYTFLTKYLTDARFRHILLPQRQLLTDMTTRGAWNFVDTVCTSGSISDPNPSGHLQVKYQFTGTGNCYAPIVSNQRLPEKTQALQFRVRGNANDTLLRVRVVDRSGEFLQYNVGLMPSTWMPVVIQLNHPLTHWGGNNNGVPDGRLILNSFVLDNADGSQSGGMVEFDDIYTSSLRGTYLFGYQKNKKIRYALWRSTIRNREFKQLLPNATTIKMRQSGVASQVITAANHVFTITASPLVRFILQ